MPQAAAETKNMECLGTLSRNIQAENHTLHECVFTAATCTFKPMQVKLRFLENTYHVWPP